MIELYLYGALVGASLAASGGVAINCYLRRQNPPAEAAVIVTPAITPREHHLEDMLGDIVDEQLSRHPRDNNAHIKIRVRTNYTNEADKGYLSNTQKEKEYDGDSESTDDSLSRTERN